MKVETFDKDSEREIPHCVPENPGILTIAINKFKTNGSIAFNFSIKESVLQLGLIT